MAFSKAILLSHGYIEHTCYNIQTDQRTSILL